MKASELAETLMEHPEAEVVVNMGAGLQVTAALVASPGYYTRRDGGFFYGLDGSDIEPNSHPVMAVLVE